MYRRDSNNSDEIFGLSSPVEFFLDPRDDILQRVNPDLQLPHPESCDVFTRHIDFLEATETAKKRANVINGTGFYMQDACLPCSLAIAQFDPNNGVGCADGINNSYFSCIKHWDFSNGRVCGRCAGLGKEVLCSSPPPESHLYVAELIKLLPAYNNAIEKLLSCTWATLDHDSKRDIAIAVLTARQLQDFTNKNVAQSDAK